MYKIFFWNSVCIFVLVQRSKYIPW
jgi:hypothetical protein